MGFLDNIRNLLGDVFYQNNGTVSFDNIDFMPQWSERKRWQYFATHGIFQSILLKGASYSTQARFKLYRNDNLIENDPSLELLNDPNQLQNKNELVKQYFINLKLHGQAFLYPIQNGTRKESIVVLHNENIQWNNFSQKAFLQSLIDRKAPYEQKLTYTINGVTLELNYSDLLIFWDTVQTKDLKAISQTDGNRKTIELTEIRLDADNKILNMPFGFYFSTQKDKSIPTGVPFKANEEADIQKKFKKHNVRSSAQWIATDKEMGVQQIMSKIKEYDLTESNIRDTRILANAINIPMELLGYESGAGFANGQERKEAELSYLQGDQLSVMQNFADGYIGWYYDDPAYRLVASFEHLPVFNERKKQKADTLRSVSASLKMLVDSGIMTTEEASETLVSYGLKD